MKVKDLPPRGSIAWKKMEICIPCDFKEKGRAKCMVMDCNAKAPWFKRKCPFGYWNGTTIN
jgi:hypothetical protein